MTPKPEGADEPVDLDAASAPGPAPRQSRRPRRAQEESVSMPGEAEIVARLEALEIVLRGLKQGDLADMLVREAHEKLSSITQEGEKLLQELADSRDETEQIRKGFVAVLLESRSASAQIGSQLKDTKEFITTHCASETQAVFNATGASVELLEQTRRNAENQVHAMGELLKTYEAKAMSIMRALVAVELRVNELVGTGLVLDPKLMATTLEAQKLLAALEAQPQTPVAAAVSLAPPPASVAPPAPATAPTPAPSAAPTAASSGNGGMDDPFFNVAPADRPPTPKPPMPPTEAELETASFHPWTRWKKRLWAGAGVAAVFMIGLGLVTRVFDPDWPHLWSCLWPKSGVTASSVLDASVAPTVAQVVNSLDGGRASGGVTSSADAGKSKPTTADYGRLPTGAPATATGKPPSSPKASDATPVTVSDAGALAARMVPEAVAPARGAKSSDKFSLTPARKPPAKLKAAIKSEKPKAGKLKCGPDEMILTYPKEYGADPECVPKT